MSEAERFGTWAILELMGHRRLAGYLTELQIAGAGFLRLDIPPIGDEQGATQFYAPSSVYAITPVTEEAAKAVALIHYYELPAPRAVTPQPEMGYEDDDDGPF